ncbi:DOMON-like domain-containing protein [Sphingosinicella humi]|uniref:DOMON-like domain-containing protein n=1 Tax=Allosphingosinicella humi TaxID=2068657 RepID=A0A2U2J5U0_9SPHN|nr:DOMON-like domain-containing protein [Sphingosinicella humi]PWG03700.1 hypothetical protein DF286_13040 [Sphingosinicella humi]
MRVALRVHPDTPSNAVSRIEVEVESTNPGKLALHYRVTGEIGEILLPPPAASTRADDLWQHSCFEAFLRDTSGTGYHEFNFAPSTQWAAYRFKDYREGRSLAAVTAPIIGARADVGCYELQATLAWAGPARMGLSAVIEERSGRKSYWALAHPPGDPDFHHSDCFALQLPPAVRP